MAVRIFQSASNIVLPSRLDNPLIAVFRRFGLALSLICIVAFMVRLDSGGYTDNKDGTVSMLDAFYYATVTITTTGYGDIVPVSNAARLMTSSVVTVARVAFLILLVGTTVEVLTQRGRAALSQHRWRKTLQNHVIVCGYGTKGRSAVATVVAQGSDISEIVVIDPDKRLIEEAAARGLAGIVGDATRTSVLDQAGARDARAVIVAPNDDATAVLTTLTVREMNPVATVAASVREGANAHLLRQGGADSVIVSSEASGRLLGIATSAPAVVDVLEDLLTAGSGLEMAQRHATVRPDGTVEEIDQARVGEIMIGVVRDGRVLHRDDPEVVPRRDGDQLIVIRSERNA